MNLEKYNKELPFTRDIVALSKKTNANGDTLYLLVVRATKEEMEEMKKTNITPTRVLEVLKDNQFIDFSEDIKLYIYSGYFPAFIESSNLEGFVSKFPHNPSRTHLLPTYRDYRMTVEEQNKVRHLVNWCTSAKRSFYTIMRALNSEYGLIIKTVKNATL